MTPQQNGQSKPLRWGHMYEFKEHSTQKANVSNSKHPLTYCLTLKGPLLPASAKREKKNTNPLILFLHFVSEARQMKAARGMFKKCQCILKPLASSGSWTRWGRGFVRQHAVSSQLITFPIVSGHNILKHNRALKSHNYVCQMWWEAGNQCSIWG